VVLVLGDANLETAVTSSSRSPPSDRENLLVTRTKDWVESVAEKMKLLTEKIVKVADDADWRVRLAMVELAENLLLKCTR